MFPTEKNKNRELKKTLNHNIGVAGYRMIFVFYFVSLIYFEQYHVFSFSNLTLDFVFYIVIKQENKNIYKLQINYTNNPTWLIY